MEADILESKKESISCPEVWRLIFWKVKRIYILSRSMEADILESKKDLYLVQKYGGRYLIYFVDVSGFLLFSFCGAFVLHLIGFFCSLHV